jgi:hypothetical protein
MDRNAFIESLKASTEQFARSMAHSAEIRRIRFDNLARESTERWHRVFCILADRGLR